MSDMTVSVLLRLVDRLSGPAKTATAGLKGIGVGAKGIVAPSNAAAAASGRLGSSLANAGRQGAQAAAGISKSGSAAGMAAGMADRASAAYKRMASAAHAAAAAAKAAAKATHAGLEIAFPKTLATPENFQKGMDKRHQAMARAQSGVLMGGITLGAVGYPLKRAADYELALTRLGNTAGFNGGDNEKNAIGSAADTFDARIAKLDKQFRADARETRQYATDILAGVDNLIARGMDQKEAIGGSKLIGKAATATAAEVEDLSNMYYALRMNLGISEGKMPKAFDIATQAGKLGGFELKNMAKWFPELTVNYSAMGIKGDQAGKMALARLSAMLQVAREGSATPDKAANNIANILQKLTIRETRKNFEKKLGIDFANEMKTAVEKGEDPIMHLLGLIDRFMAKNDDNIFLLGDLIADRQALDGLRALYTKREKVNEIVKKSLEAEQVINRDFERVSRTFAMRAKGLGIAADNLTNTLMKSPATQGKGILGVLEDAFNGLDGMAKRHPRVTGWLMDAGIGLIGFSVAARAFSWIKNGVALGALGLLKTFWKFNAAGKNISVLARAARALMTVGRFGLGAVLGGGLGMIGARAAGLYRAAGALGVLRVGLMALARFTLVGTAIWGAFEIVNNWETIAASLTAIWGRLQATWAQVKFDYNNPEQRAERYQRFEKEREQALKTGDQRSVWERMQSADWWKDGWHRFVNGPQAQRPLPAIAGIGIGGDWNTAKRNTGIGVGYGKGPASDRYNPASGAAVSMQARGIAASSMPATAAANAQPAIMGAATAPITISAQGPQVTFNQAPPVITMNAPITINMAAADPGAVGAAVSAHLNSVARGALHDGVTE